MKLIKLGRCFCRALIPPGRVCCWLHTADWGRDDGDATPVAPVRR